MARYDRNISRTKTFRCVTCGAEAPVRYNGKSLYCKQSCNPITFRGKVVSLEDRLKMSLGSKGKRKSPATEFQPGQRASMVTEFQPGHVSPWKGKTRPEMRGPNHPRWVENKKGPRPDYGSAVYQEWRTAVFVRDGYNCQSCYQHGGVLHAHHIKPWATFTDLRLEVSNGMTLCVACHRKTPTWGMHVDRQLSGVLT